MSLLRRASSRLLLHSSSLQSDTSPTGSTGRATHIQGPPLPCPCTTSDGSRPQWLLGALDWRSGCASVALLPDSDPSPSTSSGRVRGLRSRVMGSPRSLNVQCQTSIRPVKFKWPYLCPLPECMHLPHRFLSLTTLLKLLPGAKMCPEKG